MALNTVSTNRLSTNVKTSNLGTELSKKIGQNKNLIINGAMQVAQRGTSNTSGGDGYYTVDRIRYYNQGIDNDVTKAQVDVASGTSPYTEGFRKAFKLTNGNQTGGAGATDIIEFFYRIEAQDIAKSGWNYTSSSSFITLSFWCKSSVAQNFNFFVKAQDGTAQSFPYETGSLTADTWTKVVKTISGNSNLQFDDNNAEGMRLDFPVFYGTDYTGSTNLNQWNTFSGSTRTPDHTSTWYTTNDATFEITGVQLEVGSVATDFEHRSFGDELRRCQRYFQKSFDQGVNPAVSVTKSIYQFVRPYTGSNVAGVGNDLVVEMRSQPTVVLYPVQGSGSVGQVSWYGGSWGNASATYHTSTSTNKRLTLDMNINSSMVLIQYNYTASAEL